MFNSFFQLQVGKYLSYDIGYLKFKMDKVVTEGSLNVGIVVLIVILLLIVLAILLLVIIMKKKRMGPFKDKNAQKFRYVHNQSSLDAEGQRLMDQNRQNGIMLVGKKN